MNEKTWTFLTVALALAMGACGGTGLAGGGGSDPADRPEPASSPTREGIGKVRAALTGELPGDVAGILFNLYRPTDPTHPDPASDTLVASELVEPIVSDWPFIEFDAVVPAGDYYLEVIAVGTDGNPSPSCEPVRSEVFQVGAHQQTEVQLNMVCSGGQNGYVVAGVDITVTPVVITDVHQERHWNRTCSVACITTTAEDALGGAVTIRYEFTGFPAQDPGSYVTLEDAGDGTACLSAKTPGAYPIRIWAESTVGHGYDWMDVTVVFLPNEACERLEATCGQAVPVDLTADEAMPFARYECPDRTIEAPDVERALTFEGCGETVTLVSSDSAQVLVVLEETSEYGAWSGSCVAYRVAGPGAVTLDTKPGVRYVLMVERAGLGTETHITRLGCC